MDGILSQLAGGWTSNLISMPVAASLESLPPSPGISTRRIFGPQYTYSTVHTCQHMLLQYTYSTPVNTCSYSTHTQHLSTHATIVHILNTCQHMLLQYTHYIVHTCQHMLLQYTYSTPVNTCSYSTHTPHMSRHAPTVHILHISQQMLCMGSKT